LEAVLGWYEKFPEFKTNDLYVSGESYAGVYVPYLVYLLNNHIEANINNPEVFLPPLKGMMVGNGVTNWNYDTDPGAFEMSYWHSLIDKELYDNKTANNCSFNVNDDSKESDICKNISKEFNKLFTDVNIYDICGECYHSLDSGLRTSEGSINKPYWTANDYLPWRKKKN
jgi:carboxypeptidase C (cathepsin A)